MTQTKSALPVPYQRGSTIDSTTLYKGGLFSFLVKGEDSGGRDAMIEYRAKPGNEPAPYMNQWEHETYYVLEGVMEFYCGDSEVMVINAGEMVFLPQGKAHAFSIRSPQVRALILVQAVGEHAVGLDRHLMAMGTPATSMELPTEAITDEFIDPGDSIRVGAARDRKALEELFTDDFTFHSPHDPHIGKSTYFEKCWPNGDNFRTFTIEKLFVKGNEAFVRYECETKTGSKFRNTEYVRVKGDKIDRVEVYYGSLPTEI